MSRSKNQAEKRRLARRRAEEAGEPVPSWARPQSGAPRIQRSPDAPHVIDREAWTLRRILARPCPRHGAAPGEACWSLTGARTGPGTAFCGARHGGGRS